GMTPVYLIWPPPLALPYWPSSGQRTRESGLRAVLQFGYLTLRQQMLLDFPHRVSGKFLQQDEIAGNFERRQLLPAQSFDCGQIDWLSANQISYGNFATAAVGLSYNGCFGDRWMFLQKF